MDSAAVTIDITHGGISVHVKSQCNILVIKTPSAVELGTVRHDHPFPAHLHPIFIKDRDLIAADVSLEGKPVTTFISNPHGDKHDIFSIGNTIGVSFRHHPQTQRIAGLFIFVIGIDHVGTVGPSIIEFHINICIRNKAAWRHLPAIGVLP